MDKKENIFDNNEKEEQNLFSIASKEIEEERNINSFSEALKTLNDTEEEKEEISFGNLFQTAEKIEDEKNIIEETTNDISTDVTGENIPSNNMLDINKILEQEKNESEDNIFNKINDTKEPEIDIFSSEMKPETEQEEGTEEQGREVNPFLTSTSEEKTDEIEEQPEDTKTEENPFIQTELKESEESNPFLTSTSEEKIDEIEEQPEDTKTEENPFIQTESKEPEESNPFLTSTSEEKTDEIEEQPEDTKTEENRFLQSQNEKRPTINDALEAAKDKIEITNPFIIEDKEDTTPPAQENPFFENSNQNIQDKGNPFFENSTFEEQTDTEINPFFQNKIELNEKQNYQNKNKIDLSNIPHYNVKIQKKKPNKMKMLIGVLSYAVFIWLLLIGITLLVYVANIKIKQMKGDFSPPKYNAYVVLTGSMLPYIKVEDVVVTKKVDAKDLKEGDIITFASSDDRYYGTIITHRIQKKYYDSTTGKYTFQSKGDNNNVADNALVEEQNIYGKVILKIPKLGYLQVFLASKGGWILVILIPCAVVISFDIMKLFKMIARKRKLKIVK